MGKAHSGDLRERVYGEIAGGQSRRSAARRFGVSASTGVRLARRMIETGSLEPARQGRPPGGGKLAAYRELLIGWVEAEKDITMPELAVRLAEQCEVKVHPGTVRIFVCGQAVEHYAAMALMKRSPKMTANWALAMDHSRGGIFHSFSERFKIR